MKSRGPLFTEKERGARIARNQGQTLASHPDHTVSEFRGDSPHASIPGETHSSSLGNGRQGPRAQGGCTQPPAELRWGSLDCHMPTLAADKGTELGASPPPAADRSTALGASPSLSAWLRAPESVVAPHLVQAPPSAWLRAPESVVLPRSSPWPFQGASCP